MRSLLGAAFNHDREPPQMAIRPGIRRIDAAFRRPTENLEGQEDILANDRSQEPLADGPIARSWPDSNACDGAAAQIHRRSGNAPWIGIRFRAGVINSVLESFAAVQHCTIGQEGFSPMGGLFARLYPRTDGCGLPVV